MDRDINTLWALVAGLTLFVANVGVIVMVEGLTRRRRVLTVSARYIAGTSGAVFGAIGISRLDLPWLNATANATAADGVAFDSNAQLFVGVASSVLLTTLVVAGLAERATVLAHLLVGLLMGGFLGPLSASSLQPEGSLSAIEIGESGFVDAAAASVFALAGLSALIGAVVVGPRRGRSDKDGKVRFIPGKSMPAAAIGALLTFPMLVGVLARPGSGWNDAIVDAALVMVLGGAAGAVSGILVSQMILGRVGVIHVLHGLLAGLVATTGDPFNSNLIEAVIFGAVGAAIALAVLQYLSSVQIDDPVGIISVFGAAGIWGSLTVGFSNGDQFLAQVVGIVLIVSIAAIVAGALFGLLRILRLLRVRTDIEVVGLE